MKTYVELGLAALLAVLVYERPTFLVNIANTTLGIVIMIVIVGLLAKQYGINAGLLAAIIMILLQDSHREGNTSLTGGDKTMEKGMAIPDTIGADIGKECSVDTDCKPCKKTCKNAKDEFNRPKTCACESTCKAGECSASCACGECGDTCPDAPTDDDILLHGSGAIERYTNINDSLQPSGFPVTGTDQIGLSRMLKINALNAKMSASQQANGCTNNGGGIAF